MSTDAPRRSSFAPAAQRAELLDYLAIVVTVVLVLLIWSNRMAPLRLALTAGFTFYVPGRAIVSNWARMARWSGVGMSIVFSLGVLTLLAVLLLWLHEWRPMQLFVFVAVLSLIGLATGIIRRRSLSAANATANRPRPAPRGNYPPPGGNNRGNPRGNPRVNPNPRGNPRGSWLPAKPPGEPGRYHEVIRG